MNRRSPKQVPADHCFGETAPALPLQVLQVLYSIRSERLLVEQLTYNLLFRWFIGLNMDEEVWVPTVFSKNRDRLLDGDVAEACLTKYWRMRLSTRFSPL